jgi:hypothetical protein
MCFSCEGENHVRHVKPDSEVARTKTVKFTEVLGFGDGCGHPMDVKRIRGECWFGWKE